LMQRINHDRLYRRFRHVFSHADTWSNSDRESKLPARNWWTNVGPENSLSQRSAISWLDQDWATRALILTTTW